MYVCIFERLEYRNYYPPIFLYSLIAWCVVLFLHIICFAVACDHFLQDTKTLLLSLGGEQKGDDRFLAERLSAQLQAAQYVGLNHGIKLVVVVVVVVVVAVVAALVVVVVVMVIAVMT